MDVVWYDLDRTPRKGGNLCKHHQILSSLAMCVHPEKSETQPLKRFTLWSLTHIVNYTNLGTHNDWCIWLVMGYEKRYRFWPPKIKFFFVSSFFELYFWANLGKWIQKEVWKYLSYRKQINLQMEKAQKSSISNNPTKSDGRKV